MLLKLAFLFIAVPALELYLMILIGSQIGAVATIAVVVVTGFLGAYLAKTQGAAVMRRSWSEIQAGRMPAEEILHGLLIVFAGVVLLTPGFITDTAGFLLLLPFSRTALLVFLRRKLEAYIAVKGYSRKGSEDCGVGMEEGSGE